MLGFGLNLIGLKKSSSGSGIPAIPFPNLEPNLIHKDFLGFGRVFQDSAGTIPISAVGQPVAFVTDYSTTSDSLLWDDGSTVLLWDDNTTELVLDDLSHAIQVTSSRRPLLKIDESGRFYLNHDRIDDYLTLTSLNSGTYTFGIASWCGVQIYETYQKTTGEFQFNPVDTHSRVLVSGSLTTQQKTDLRAWLESRRIPSGTSDVMRFYTSSNSVNLSVLESSSSGSSWVLGDGQTAIGISCVKTISAPQTVIYRATSPNKITELNWSSKSLYGMIDLTKLTGLITVYLSTNSFAGGLDLTNNTALQMLYVSNNLLGGILKLTTNTALTTLQVGNNLFNGTIDISTNILLTTAGFSTNRFSGFTGTVSNTVGDFNAANNLLTQAAVDAILLAFVNANKTTGTRTLTLNGTGNAAPSVTGLGYKSTLVSRGWTVSHN